MSDLTSVTDGTRAWCADRRVPLEYRDETGSTNDDAKALPEAPPAWVTLTAHQRAGRGRGANVWRDVGAGQILLASFAFDLDTPPRAITAPRIGLALYRALTAAWPALPWGLKAPNDIYLSKGKAAGLLIEVTSRGPHNRLIVGLGLNVLARPALDTAISLTEALGHPPRVGDWFAFLDNWWAQLHAALPDVARPGLDPAVRRELRLGLNANAARAYDVTEVSEFGDLTHAGGLVRWGEL